MTWPNTAWLSTRSTASPRPRAASAARAEGSVKDMVKRFYAEYALPPRVNFLSASGDSAGCGAALLDHAADLLHGLGNRLLHAFHVPAGQRDQAHLRRRRDGGVAQGALEQSD